jgi:hypothetical protein
MADVALKVGDVVVVVEHDEATRTPREGGRRLPARVVDAFGGGEEGIYVHVVYEDRAINRGRPDVFYRDSGWRAWDGVMRWRLTTKESGR